MLFECCDDTRCKSARSPSRLYGRVWRLSDEHRPFQRPSPDMNITRAFDLHETRVGSLGFLRCTVVHEATGLCLTAE